MRRSSWARKTRAALQIGERAVSLLEKKDWHMVEGKGCCRNGMEALLLRYNGALTFQFQVRLPTTASAMGTRRGSVPVHYLQNICPNNPTPRTEYSVANIAFRGGVHSNMPPDKAQFPLYHGKTTPSAPPSLLSVSRSCADHLRSVHWEFLLGSLILFHLLTG